MPALTTPLINLGPKLDEFLRRRPMTPEQAATSRELKAAGVVGLETVCIARPDGLSEVVPDLGPDGADNGGRLLGALPRGWRFERGDAWIARNLAAPYWQGVAAVWSGDVLLVLANLYVYGRVLRK